MAHIFKFSKGKQKGILVFTHKEWDFFTGNKVIRKLKRDGNWPRINFPFFMELRNPYRITIEYLSKSYYIGVHFGHFRSNLFKSEYVDFVMSGVGTLPYLDSSIYRIPFNSRNFIPKEFSLVTTKRKKWDIITVGMNVLVKNYDLLFHSLKKLLEVRPQTTCLLIVPSQAKVKWGVYNSIAEDYYSLFTKEEQKQITFLYLHPDLDYGIHQQQIIDFYQRSRVFTLFSKKEGESRVISEALCCGLTIVVYKNLIGGGRDLLSNKNSIQFDSFDKAHEAFIKALRMFPDGIKDQPEIFTREDFTIPKLMEYFSVLYERDKYEFDKKLINLDHLDTRLPAHYSDVPWKLHPKKPTADILSRNQFNAFLNYLDENCY